MERVSVSWADESHTALIFVFRQSFTLEDYLSSVKYSRKLVADAQPDSYGVIADVTNMKFPPRRFIVQMRNEYKIPDSSFSNITVIVGASMLIRHLENIFREIFTPHRFLFADTIDEAVTILQQVRH